MNEKRERGRPRNDTPGRAYGHETRPPKVRPEGRPVRIYARTNEDAERVGGPNAVAVLDAKVVLPVELWAQLKRTVVGMRAMGSNVDASYIVELNLKATITALEAAYNDGHPFEEVEAPPTKRRPIPRAKIKRDG